MAGTSVSAQTLIPGFRGGGHITWDGGSSSLLAIELAAAGESDDGTIPVCVMHPDSLQVSFCLPFCHTLKLSSAWGLPDSGVRFSKHQFLLTMDRHRLVDWVYTISLCFDRLAETAETAVNSTVHAHRSMQFCTYPRRRSKATTMKGSGLLLLNWYRWLGHRFMPHQCCSLRLDRCTCNHRWMNPQFIAVRQ